MMGFKKHMIGLTVGCLMSMGAWGQAAVSHGLAFNELAHQHIDLNLANAPQTGYVGFFGMGQHAFMFTNTVMHPARWLTTLPSQQTAIQLNDIFDGFGGRNDLSVNYSLDWLKVGVFSPKRTSFWHIHIREVAHMGLALPSDLLRLPFTGNAKFNLMGDETIDLSPLRFRAQYHREYAAGWQHQWQESFSTGIRLKYITGFLHADAQVNEGNLRTDPTDWSWDIHGSGQVFTSGVDQLLGLSDSIPSEINWYGFGSLENQRNHGFGLDVAAQYHWSERLWAFAQASDIGMIWWRNDVLNFDLPAFTASFDGIEVNGSSDVLEWDADSLESWGEALRDDWDSQWQPSENHQSYRTGLQASWRVGVGMGVHDNTAWNTTFGWLLNQDRGQPISWRMSWNQRVLNWMQASLSYGQRNGTLGSWGASLVVPLGPLQCMVGIDSSRLLDWTKIVLDPEWEEVSTEWIVPTHAPMIQGQFGLTWRLGWRTKSKRKSESEAGPPSPEVPVSSTRSPEWTEL